MRSSSNLIGPATRRILKLAGDENEIRRAVEVVANSFLPVPYAPPTNLSLLFERLRIAKCEEADILTNGELRRVGRFYEIYYSTKQSASRMRFTIAHELGHAILESTGPRCPQTGSEVEHLCDLLATSLLLPRRPFIETLGQNRSPQAILDAAKTFDVSIMAAALRFAAIYNASVFEADNTRIVWGQGVVRKGYITGDIKASVEKALCGKAGAEQVIFEDGRSRLLQWVPLGYGRRALFTATQVR